MRKNAKIQYLFQTRLYCSDEGNTDDAKNLSIIEEETESTFPDTEVLVEHGKAE